jgi:hypothetical protein
VWDRHGGYRVNWRLLDSCFQILESRGCEVSLVNAHYLKSVPGRKSDVSDCQWIRGAGRTAAISEIIGSTSEPVGKAAGTAVPRPDKQGWFEVIAGKSVVAFRREEEAEAPPAKGFGFVQTYDREPRGRLWESMKSRGMQENQ